MNKLLIVSILNVFISVMVKADQVPNGAEIYKTIAEQTKAQNYSLDQLPQNLGGSEKKLYNDNSAKLSKLQLEIASSDEAVFQQVVRAIFQPLEMSLQNKSVKDLKFFKNASAYAFSIKDQTNQKIFDNIHQSAWTLNDKPQNIESVLANMDKFLSNYKSIEFVEVSPYSTSTPLPKRSFKTFQPLYFDVVARVDIRGIDKKNQRHQDKFEVKMSVERPEVANSQWMVSSLLLSSGETLTTAKAAFRELTAFSDVAPDNSLRKEAIRRGGYAISMCDYDNDGNVDMIVGHRGSLEFFKGDGTGHFSKVPNATIGISDDTLVKSIVCNDFDNDGLKDLLVVRFAPSEQAGNDIIMYHNKGGGKFEKQTTIKNRAPAYYAMPAAVADFNGDGMLDFYIGFPGAKDFTVLNKQNSGFSGLKELHPQGLFYNTGNFAFEEVTKEKIPYTKTKNAYTDGYPESAVIFPHTATAIDYDLDGNMDIVVIDDKANLSPLYKNTGSGKFVQIADKIGVNNSDFGMGFAAGDLFNDGHLDFIYTNVNFLSSERMSNSLVNNFSNYDRFPGTYGIRIFRTKDGKNYSDVTALSGIKDTGYGLGGVEVIDYNNSGLLSFYVPTGLWSGNNKQEDISSLFSRAYLKYDLDYEEVMGSPQGIEQANTSFMKVLEDFRGDVLTGAKDSKKAPSMTGFQRNRLFRNNGDGTFTDVAYMLGVDSMADGFMVTTADLRNSGKMDLILRNADPGTEMNMFPSVQVFLNEMPTKNKSLMLTLEGTKSNHDAIGAIVEAKVGPKHLIRHMIANNGSAQSQNIIHIGLGKYTQVDELKIRWPSGLTDTYKNVPAGRKHYKEANESNHLVKE